MTKTIAQIWNGELKPIRYLGKNNSEIQQIENLLQRNLEELEQILSDTEKEVFKKYNDCINEYLFLIGEQAFCDGFCLGTKIIAEAMTGTEQLTSI